MHVILIKDHLPPFQIEGLMKEFPHYQVLLDTGSEAADRELLRFDEIEILYSSSLTEDELSRMSNLRWIHIPQTSTASLCMNAITERGNILVSSTEDEDLEQIAEYAHAAVLAFSKRLFAWKNTPKDLSIRNEMWSLEGKLFFQIGLGGIGSEIAKKAKSTGFRVWGFRKSASFHPSCHECMPLSELKDVLVQADVICIALPRDETLRFTMTADLLKTTKRDAILLYFNEEESLNMRDLAEVAKEKEFRGIMLDTTQSIPDDSPLWSMPNTLITRSISRYPRRLRGAAIKTFLFNMRQFLHGNFADMRHRVR